MYIEKIKQLIDTGSFENINLALQLGKNHNDRSVREFTLRKEKEIVNEYIGFAHDFDKQEYALNIINESEQDLTQELARLIVIKFGIVEEENPINMNIAIGINSNKVILKKPFVTTFKLDKEFFKNYPKIRTYKITPSGIMDEEARSLINVLLSNKKKRYIEIEKVIFENKRAKLITDTGAKLLLEPRVLNIFDGSDHLYVGKKLGNLLKNILSK